MVQLLNSRTVLIKTINTGGLLCAWIQYKDPLCLFEKDKLAMAGKVIGYLPHTSPCAQGGPLNKMIKSDLMYRMINYI